MSMFNVVVTVKFETGEEFTPDDAALEGLSRDAGENIRQVLAAAGMQDLDITVNRGAGGGNPRANDKVVVFPGEVGDQWYWRRKAANGRTIAVGGEGYQNRADCEAMARGVNADLPEGAVSVEEKS